MSTDPDPVRSRGERWAWVVFSLLLALPLVANPIARGLGFELFYLADARLQAFWGTLAQVVGGWALYRDAVGHLRRGGAARTFWLCLLATLLYGLSLYIVLVRHGTGQTFLGPALLISLAYLAAARSGGGQPS